MAENGAATATSRRPLIFARPTPHWVARIRVPLLVACAAVILVMSAGQTILGRYVYYRAEDAAVAARKELRQTVDAAHNWWHHVKKTVARRDKSRGGSRVPLALDDESERWVGMIDVPRP